MSKEKYYKISESELRDLLYDAAKVAVLERDGVDNWQFYYESYAETVADFMEVSVEEAEENDLSLADVVDKWIKEDYEEIK